MSVLVKIMQETLPNKIKKFIFLQKKKFSVLFTPGYIKEKQEQCDSGHFFAPANGIKPRCFNVSMLGKDTVFTCSIVKYI